MPSTSLSFYRLKEHSIHVKNITLPMKSQPLKRNFEVLRSEGGEGCEVIQFYILPAEWVNISPRTSIEPLVRALYLIEKGTFTIKLFQPEKFDTSISRLQLESIFSSLKIN